MGRLPLRIKHLANCFLVKYFKKYFNRKRRSRNYTFFDATCITPDKKVLVQYCDILCTHLNIESM